MDNPQETDNSNIKWLAGFFDAEGSVSFNCKPCIDIVNTCPRTSFYIKDTFSKIGINIEIHKREEPSKSSKKPRWDIFLRRKRQIMPFLKIIKPYVRGRRKQLELVEEWYKTPFEGVTEKIQFLNQVHNKIIFKKEVVKNKLKTESLEKYQDIPVLNEDDGYIVTNSFNCLDYISGLIDGDGCINMHYKSSKKSQYEKYSPQVLFTNTDKEIVRSYCSVLKNNSIGYLVTFRTAGKATDRRRWDILVVGVKRCHNFLDLIVNRLETKREQANLLLQYCKNRLLSRKNKNNIGFECKKALEGMKKGFYV